MEALPDENAKNMAHALGRYGINLTSKKQPDYSILSKERVEQEKMKKPHIIDLHNDYNSMLVTIDADGYIQRSTNEMNLKIKFDVFAKTIDSLKGLLGL